MGIQPVKILALDTSTAHGTVALLQESELLEQVDLDPGRRSAQTLVPTIQQLLKQHEWKPQQVELVAVAVGPGSFTGLRLAVATAKVFAYAVEAEVLGINTLEAIAWGGIAGSGTLHVGMDAQRGEVFAARFVRKEETAPWQMTGGVELLARQRWLEQMAPGDLVAGPVLQQLQESLPEQVTPVPQELCFPQAAAVGRLAWHLWQQGQRQDLWGLLPQYYRPSAAQEKRMRSMPAKDAEPGASAC